MSFRIRWEVVAYPVFLFLFLGVSIVTTANAGMARGTVDTGNTFGGMLSPDAELCQQIGRNTFDKREPVQQTRPLGFLRGSPLRKVNKALYGPFQCSFGFLTVIKYNQICFN